MRSVLLKKASIPSVFPNSVKNSPSPSPCPHQKPSPHSKNNSPAKSGRPRNFATNYTVEIDRDIIRAAAAHLKDDLGFNFLLDITSVDHFGDEPRYEVVYEFCALGGPNNQEHLRVKIKVGEDETAVDSIITVFQGADWHEREIYDMMGIKFKGHPDLRRILMWDGYPYHPLRRIFLSKACPATCPVKKASAAARPGRRPLRRRSDRQAARHRRRAHHHPRTPRQPRRP